MFDYPLVKVIDPTSIVLTMWPREFVQEYAPAYGETWYNATEMLYNCDADHSIISKLSRELRAFGEFRELPKVQLPMSDLDDRVEYNAAVANGMHRITVMRAAVMPIKFTPFYPFLPEEDVYTRVELVFMDDIGTEGDDTIFPWFRSIPLDNGDWVETCMGSLDGRRYNLWLDKVVDHKVLLKKIHSLAVLDEIAALGLVEIHIEDISDDEEDENE